MHRSVNCRSVLQFFNEPLQIHNETTSYFVHSSTRDLPGQESVADRKCRFAHLLIFSSASSDSPCQHLGDHQGFIIQHFQDALLIAREAADLLDKSYGSDSNVNDVVDALFTGGSEAVKKCTGTIQRLFPLFSLSPFWSAKYMAGVEILRNIASYDQSPSESFLKPDNMDLVSK